MKIQYKYLSTGCVVGDVSGQMPSNEGDLRIRPEEKHFYLDVGGSACAQVLDHHDGGAGCLSTSQLVFDRFEDKIGKTIKEHLWDEATLVTHRNVDLDAAGSLYYITRKLQKAPLNDKKWEEVAQVITANDQGYIPFPINDSIPAYFKAMREIHLKQCPSQSERSDTTPVFIKQEDDFLEKKAFPFFDDILALLEEEETAIHEVCRRLKGRNYLEIRNLIRSAEMLY